MRLILSPLRASVRNMEKIKIYIFLNEKGILPEQEWRVGIVSPWGYMYVQRLYR